MKTKVSPNIFHPMQMHTQDNEKWDWGAAVSPCSEWRLEVVSTEQVLSWLLEGQWPFRWPQQEGQANDTANDVPPTEVVPIIGSRNSESWEGRCLAVGKQMAKSRPPGYSDSRCCAQYFSIGVRSPWRSIEAKQDATGLSLLCGLLITSLKTFNRTEIAILLYFH